MGSIVLVLMHERTIIFVIVFVLFFFSFVDITVTEFVKVMNDSSLTT